jgi:hypothetical protein
MVSPGETSPKIPDAIFKSGADILLPTTGGGRSKQAALEWDGKRAKRSKSFARFLIGSVIWA